MKKKFRKNLKGVSTVIATIIIVAISIVMAIAVAYWVLGIGGSFTRFEKLEFTSAWASYSQSSGYTINLMLKNTGSASATIDASSIMYNGKPDIAYGSFAPTANLNTSALPIPKTRVTLEPGAAINATITLKNTVGTPWVSSMSVEVMIQTTAGRTYPKVVVLP